VDNAARGAVYDGVTRDGLLAPNLAHGAPAGVTDAGTGISFPAQVIALSDEIWRVGRIIEPVVESRYEARAWVRAALIRLRTVHPIESWPAGLVGGYRRTFGKRWATSEGGRGMREVLRVLGYDGGTEGVVGWIGRILV
jgi:hypothetical protein